MNSLLEQIVLINVEEKKARTNGGNKVNKKKKKKRQSKRKNRILVYLVLYLKIQILIKVLLLNIVNRSKHENQNDDGVSMYSKANRYV